MYWSEIKRHTATRGLEVTKAKIARVQTYRYNVTWRCSMSFRYKFKFTMKVGDYILNIFNGHGWVVIDLPSCSELDRGSLQNCSIVTGLRSQGNVLKSSNIWYLGFSWFEVKRRLGNALWNLKSLYLKTEGERDERHKKVPLKYDNRVSCKRKQNWGILN